MKKSKLFAKGFATVFALATMFSVVTNVYADENTETTKPRIDMVFQNEVETRKMSEEDAEIFADAMGYGSFSGTVHVCSEDTSADINWENSLIPMEEVYVTAIIVPNISRDEDDNLVVTMEYAYEYVLEEIWNETSCANIGGVGHGEYFDKTGNRAPNNFIDGEYDSSLCINDNMGITSVSKSKVGSGYYTIDISDIYVIRVRYTTDGLGNIYGEGSDVEDRTYGYSDFIILPEGVNSVLFSDGTCTHTSTKLANEKQATCTEKGYTGDTVCADCGVTISAGKEIVAKGHTNKTTMTKATLKRDGKEVENCTVCQKTISTSTISKVQSVKLSATNYVYNGKTKTPSVIVKDANGKTLKKNTDYTITYVGGRKQVGKYTVKVTLKGKYSGTKTLSFTIQPKATAVKKLTATKKGFKVQWKKLTSQTTGYQIQYSTKSSFKGSKTKFVTKSSTSSKSIKKLSAKKKYYVRIRTYKTVKINGKSTKIYSTWSKAKTVTTKK